jgi:diamine N-acetyltransferase
MFLSGQLVSLRALEPDDIDLLYNWENDADIWHLSNTLTPFSRFDLEQYVLNAAKDVHTDKQVRLMIVEKSGSATVGAIDLFEFNPLNQRIGVGILIAEAYRNKGFASEAVELVIRYCFDILRVHQVFANITEDNPDSIRLFEKKGFIRSGIKKDWLLKNEIWVDEYFYQCFNPHLKNNGG